MRIYISLIYVLVLDIFCQQLGNICQFNLCIGIGYILPTIGDISHLENVFGRRVGGICIVYCLEHTFILDIYCQRFENIYQLNILIGIGYILPTIGDISQLGSVCVVDVRCGQCPILHTVWWMSGVMNVWCGGCLVWSMSGVVNVLFYTRCGGCLV